MLYKFGNAPGCVVWLSEEALGESMRQWERGQKRLTSAAQAHPTSPLAPPQPDRDPSGESVDAAEQGSTA
jgi:hypothetical protein